MNRKISHGLSAVVILSAAGSTAAVATVNAAGYPTSPAICTGKYFHVQAEPGRPGAGYDLIGGGTTWYIGYSAPNQPTTPGETSTPAPPGTALSPAALPVERRGTPYRSVRARCR